MAVPPAAAFGGGECLERGAERAWGFGVSQLYHSGVGRVATSPTRQEAGRGGRRMGRAAGRRVAVAAPHRFALSWTRVRQTSPPCVLGVELKLVDGENGLFCCKFLSYDSSIERTSGRFYPGFYSVVTCYRELYSTVVLNTALLRAWKKNWRLKHSENGSFRTGTG